MNSTAGDGMFTRDPDLPNLIVTRHPLLRHKVTLLRKRDTPKKIFKELVDEIAMLLAYEVTSDLGTETVRVETPLESTTGDIVLVVHEGSAFEAATGQEWVFQVAEFQRELEAWKREPKPLARRRSAPSTGSEAAETEARWRLE